MADVNLEQKETKSNDFENVIKFEKKKEIDPETENNDFDSLSEFKMKADFTQTTLRMTRDFFSTGANLKITGSKAYFIASNLQKCIDFLTLATALATRKLKEADQEKDIKQYVDLPYSPASELIGEARINRTGKHSVTLEEQIASLPELLECVLEVGMNSVEYQRSKESGMAVAMRCLAATTAALKDELDVDENKND